MPFNTLILAAGAGKRMKSHTAKVAHELLGKPLVCWVVDAARKAGSVNTVVVVGNRRDQVVPLLKDALIAVQTEQLGTGHAVMVASEHLQNFDPDSSLIIVNGDTPLVSPDTLAALADFRESEAAACCVAGFIPENPYGYGRLIRAANGNLLAIVEELDATPEEKKIAQVNSGIYCFHLASLLQCLQNLDNDNAQNEYLLTQAVELLVAAAQKVAIWMIEDNDQLIGINDRLQLANAAAVAQRRINREHMINGVTMLDPTSTWIGPDVEIASDVEVLPMTIIYGKCQIGQDSVIGPNTRLNNVRIGSGCIVDESIVIDSTLEDRVSCGPRSYLRPGTVMRAGSKAGTHVEIKNSEIGSDSKVPHLSYIGDASVGSGVNIGAGSITCNFDGVRKHRTVIGDRSFIGSDTMFVAPVKVGNDVLVGAGSVITDDVSDGKLAIARAKQIEKPSKANHTNASQPEGGSE